MIFCSNKVSISWIPFRFLKNYFQNECDISFTSVDGIFGEIFSVKFSLCKQMENPTEVGEVAKEQTEQIGPSNQEEEDTFREPILDGRNVNPKFWKSTFGLNYYFSSPKITFKTKILNDYLTCRLCKGYFREPYTITECLHTCNHPFPIAVSDILP